MAYRQVDHTADLALEIEAPDLSSLMAEAARALTDCITDVAAVRPRQARRVDLAAPDAEALLVDWLGELLYLYETAGLLVAEADVAVRPGADGLALAATVRGEPADPARHPYKLLVKAVTYHDLSVRCDADGCRARLVLDI